MLTYGFLRFQRGPADLRPPKVKTGSAKTCKPSCGLLTAIRGFSFLCFSNLENIHPFSSASKKKLLFGLTVG